MARIHSPPIKQVPRQFGDSLLAPVPRPQRRLAEFAFAAVRPYCSGCFAASLPLRPTERPSCSIRLPSHHRLAVLAAACGLAVLVAPAAHAFTIDQQSNTTSRRLGALHRSRRALLRLRQRPDDPAGQHHHPVRRPAGLVRPALQPQSDVRSARPAGRGGR